MSLDTLYPTTPEAIDLREPEKPIKPQRVSEAKGDKTMTVSKFEVIKYTVILYLGLMGVWQTFWNVYCFVAPDATVFKNLRGIEQKERAYLESYLDACSMGNWFENKTNKCLVSASAVATLLKGEAVIAHIGPQELPLSQQKPDHQAWEQQAEAADVPAGNAQSPE